MPPAPHVAAMRKKLIARGLLTHDLKLTAAGERHCDELVERLKRQAQEARALPAPANWGRG